MKHIKKINYIWILIFSILSCQSNSNSEENTTDSTKAASVSFSLTNEQIKSLRIELTSPQKTQIQTEKMVNGTVMVDPNTALEIHVPYAGYLKNARLLDGQSVSAGQVVGMIENPYFLEVQRDYLQSRIELSKIRSEYERFQKLWNSKSISEKEWIEAKSSYESTQLKNQSLRQLLITLHLQPEKINAENLSAQVPLISPISGIITESNVNNGKYYQPEERIAKVINLSSAYLELTAFERDKNSIHLNDQIAAYEIENTEAQIKAIVSSVDPSIASDGSFKLLAKIKSTEFNLKNGMHVQAKISGISESAFQLPKSCLVGNPDAPQLVQSISENDFKLVSIVLLKEDNQFIYFHFKDSKKAKNKYVNQGAYDIYMEMLKE